MSQSSLSQRLCDYRDAILRWQKAERENNPLINFPRRADYHLAPDCWGAREVEKALRFNAENPA